MDNPALAEELEDKIKKALGSPTSNEEVLQD
jgi:hypothetical protein